VISRRAFAALALAILVLVAGFLLLGFRLAHVEREIHGLNARCGAPHATPHHHAIWAAP
jgi:hypothetical protein